MAVMTMLHAAFGDNQGPALPDGAQAEFDIVSAVPGESFVQQADGIERGTAQQDAYERNIRGRALPIGSERMAGLGGAVVYAIANDLR